MNFAHAHENMLSNVPGDMKEVSTLCKSLFEPDDHAEVNVIVAGRCAVWGVIMRRQANTQKAGADVGAAYDAEASWLA